MSLYTIVLFIHIAGAIGYFFSISNWLFILVALRRARHVEQVRALMRLNGLAGPFGGISAAVLLVAGLYLAVSSWNVLTSWILVALILLLMMVPCAAALMAPRRKALLAELDRPTPDGAISEALWQRIYDPVVTTTVQTVAALLLGIVFLMTTKPDLPGSITVIAIALFLGLLSSVLVIQTRKRTELSGEAHQVKEG